MIQALKFFLIAKLYRLDPLHKLTCQYVSSYGDTYYMHLCSIYIVLYDVPSILER